MNTINTVKLTNHILSTVYEGLLKLGGLEDENYSIYYDLDLLNYLLGYNFTCNEECEIFLENIYSDSNEYQIRVVLEKGRFKFTVPASSMNLVRELGDTSGFLKALINLVGSHHFTLEDIKDIFLQYSNDYVCEKTDHPEFQYVFYFKENSINDYK